jgi:hypothetical protein
LPNGKVSRELAGWLFNRWVIDRDWLTLLPVLQELLADQVELRFCVISLRRSLRFFSVSVSSNQLRIIGQQWLQAFNGWLLCQWPDWAKQYPGPGSEAVLLALPSESQWEAGWRAGSAWPFHFGATLDPSWARYMATYTYGKGRRREYEKRPLPIGFFGLLNQWGLAQMQGQLLAWCADQWHRDSMSDAPRQGSVVEGPDPGQAEVAAAVSSPQSPF